MAAFGIVAAAVQARGYPEIAKDEGAEGARARGQLTNDENDGRQRAWDAPHRLPSCKMGGRNGEP